MYQRTLVARFQGVSRATPALRAARVISLIIIPLIVVASAGGLFIDGLYRDNLWVSSQFRGSDLVRLIVAIPVFIWALLGALRGSAAALLVWLGMLWLTVYDYAFYLFGAAFNELFLIYVALLSLSIIGLVFGLVSIDANSISRRFSTRTPVRWISAYLLFVAAFLGGLWTFQSVDFILTGRLPQSLVDSGIHTNLVFALDLALLVPGLILAANWLWRRRPWGYVLAAVMLVKAALYPLVLLGMSVFYARATGSWDAMTPFWVFFAVASLSFAGLLFGNLQSSDSRQHGRG